jgi:hypothetical protein
MKRFTKWLCLLLLTTALLLPHYANAARGIAVRPISPSGAEVKGDQWLFIIGIDTYIHWPRLKTAVNDGNAVRDVLLSRYHFDKDHLIELYDEQATRKNIIGKLRYLANKVRKDDSLLIFYAGHGNLDSITKSGSWIPVESGINDASAWISNQSIKNYLKVDAIKAKHVLLISDSCFAGDFFRGHRRKLPKVTDEVIKRAYKLTSRQAITSGGLEPVVDEGFGNHSVFSYFLIKTLKENQSPFLVPSDFFVEVKAGVAENAEQFPQFGSLKGTGGQQGGELVLFLKHDSKLKKLSDKATERKKELQRLKQMEAAVTAARKKEAQEIAKQEKRLAGLDKKIEEMRGRLGSPAKRSDDSLETLFAMVRQQEDQERRLKELEQKRREKERKRTAEIQRLKEEQEKKRRETFEADLSKYLQIVKSKYGKDMKVLAWKSLISRYPEGKKLNVDDIEGLKLAFRGVGRLYVTTKPKNAEIRLINIKQEFYQGMVLRKGNYEIMVSKDRYDSKTVVISIDYGENKKLNVHLDLSAKELKRLEAERRLREEKRKQQQREQEEKRKQQQREQEEKRKQQQLRDLQETPVISETLPVVRYKTRSNVKPGWSKSYSWTFTDRYGKNHSVQVIVHAKKKRIGWIVESCPAWSFTVDGRSLERDGPVYGCWSMTLGLRIDPLALVIDGTEFRIYRTDYGTPDVRRMPRMNLGES